MSEHAPQPMPQAERTGLHLEPVKPGELGEELVTNPENYDPNNPDFTPVAAMAHEPWSLKDYGMDVEAPKPEEPTPGIDPVMAHETGTLDDYKGAGTKPAESTPEDPKDTDPFKRIGDAVNGRVDELKKEGNSEADADAEAHDEFWGKVPQDEKQKPGTNEDDPIQEIEVITPEKEDIKLPEELQKQLDAARDQYILLSSKRRNISSFGHKKKLDAARDAWKQARDAAGTYVAEQMLANGESQEDIELLSLWGRAQEVQILEGGIKDLRMKEADKRWFKGFYNKWAQWGGKRPDGKRNIAGFVKKGLTMGIVGGAVTFVAGAAFGAGGAALLATRVARGLMGGKINKEANATSVAEAQFNAQKERADDVTAIGDRVATNDDVTEVVEGLTNETVGRNRRRLIGSIALAAAGGYVGSKVAGALHSWFGGPSGSITPVGKPIPTGPKGGELGIPPFGTKTPELVPTDSRLPWIHTNELLQKFGDIKGGNNSTPAIFDLVSRGKQFGIDITGEGRSLTSVTYNGQTFTDNGHINAALDEILRRTLTEEAQKAATRS